MSSERLFDESALRKLEQLALIAHRVRAGVMKGERRSPKRGTSLEFADYRNYTRGDDLRRLDWNIYARLEKPFLKLFEEEEDLTVHVLLDASGSMDWPKEGEADLHKLRYGLRLAGALAHIGLSGGDRVAVGVLRNHALAELWGPKRGRGLTFRLLDWLETIPPGGTTALSRALRDYGLRGGRPGLALLITDFLSPDGYQEGLSALQGRGYEVTVVHLMTPDEIDPPLTGDLRLIDAETGDGQDVTLDGALHDLYRRRLLAWRDEIASHCANRDVHYLFVRTDTPWENVVLYNLRRAAVVT